MERNRTPVLKENEAGVLCVEEAVEQLLTALPAHELARMVRLVGRIKESDLPPARPIPPVDESGIDADAVLRFVRGQARPVTRREIQQALGTKAPARRWSRLLTKLTSTGQIDADGYGRARRYWAS